MSLGHWLGLAGLPLVMGCVSYSPHFSAEPLPIGTGQTSLSVDALLLDRGFGPEWFAAPDIGFRRSIAEAWDVGTRLYPLGFELSSRARVAHWPGFDVSLAPLLALGQVSATNADTSFAELTSGALLLGGFDLGWNRELVLGLRSQLRLGLNSVAVHEDFSAARWGLLCGGSLALRVPVNERASWFPGIAVLVPYDVSRQARDFVIVQGGGSLVW